MKLRFAALSLILFVTTGSFASAQILSADFTEILTLSGSTATLSATGQSVSYTLSASPLSSGATYTNPGSLVGSVDVTLSSSGLITLTDNSSGNKNFNTLSFSLSNIQFSTGQTITGITTLTSTAITNHAGSTLVYNPTHTGSSAGLDFTTTNPGTDLISINGSTSSPSTYQLQLSSVPEPREWALIMLLGLGGLIVVRKIRSRSLSAACEA